MPGIASVRLDYMPVAIEVIGALRAASSGTLSYI